MGNCSLKMKGKDIFEVLRTQTLREAKLFFEAGVKTPYRQCIDDLVKITEQTSFSQYQGKKSDQAFKLQQIMKKIKFEMKERYFSLLSKLKDTMHQIGEDLELKLKRANNTIQNSNIDVAQKSSTFNKIIIMLLYDFEFGIFYTAIFGPNSLSQKVKPSNNLNSEECDPFDVACNMINCLFETMPEINNLFDMIFSEYEERLRSLSEKDAITAVVSNYNQSKAASIIWFSKSEQDKIEYFEQLKQTFPGEELVFMNSPTEFFGRIREHSHVHLIISGSLCEPLIGSIAQYNQIHSITIFCNDLDNHRQWAKQYGLIRCITRQFDEVISSVGLHIKSIKFFQTCSLRDLKASFNQNDPFHYVKKEFSQSFLGKLSRTQILQIIRATITRLSPEIQATSCRLLVDNQEKLSEVIAKNFKSSKELINLYTQEQPQFFSIMNRLLSTLNESAIIAFSPIISSLRSSLINYDDETSIKECPKLYRGIDCCVDSFLKSFTVNDIIIFPGFTSTSSERLTALGFANQKILLEISYPQDIFNHNFHYQTFYQSHFPLKDESQCELMRAKNIEKVSSFKGEKEYLFPCFSAFKILACSNKYECTCIEIEFIILEDDAEVNTYLQNDQTTLFQFVKENEKQRQQEKEKQCQESKQIQQNDQMAAFVFHDETQENNLHIMQQQLEEEKVMEQKQNHQLNQVQNYKSSGPKPPDYKM